MCIDTEVVLALTRLSVPIVLLFYLFFLMFEVKNVQPILKRNSILK